MSDDISVEIAIELRKALRHLGADPKEVLPNWYRQRRDLSDLRTARSAVGPAWDRPQLGA